MLAIEKLSGHRHEMLLVEGPSSQDRLATTLFLGLPDRRLIALYAGFVEIDPISVGHA